MKTIILLKVKKSNYHQGVAIIIIIHSNSSSLAGDEKLNRGSDVEMLGYLPRFILFEGFSSFDP